MTLRNRLHVDQTNVDVPLNGDAAPATAAVAATAAAAAAALNLVTTAQQAPPASAAVAAAAAAAHLTNGPFVTNHTSMQMGSSTILPVAKANPKVGAPTQYAPNKNLCARRCRIAKPHTLTRIGARSANSNIVRINSAICRLTKVKPPRNER